MRGATQRLTTARDPAAFQPTRPLRGATPILDSGSNSSINFNPRAPCGARHSDARAIRSEANFNPRAPCGARRRYRVTKRGNCLHFNPRAPCGARHHLSSPPEKALNFNPRAPCGARLFRCSYCSYCSTFQPTRPLRGATPDGSLLASIQKISTHAPLAGRDKTA